MFLRFPFRLRLTSSFVVLLASLCTGQVLAQVTIPISSGPANCGSRMYTDIFDVIGLNAVDPNEAAYFANSEPGVIGLTIFFEIRPNGGPSTYGSAGTGAMISVAATAYNRANTTNTDIYSGRPESVLAAAKDMSAVWVHKQDGSGALQSKQASTLNTILAGPTTSSDCDGLIYSWVMAQNFYTRYSNAVQTNPYTVNIQNTFVGSEFFNSTGNQPSVSPSRRQYLNELGLWNVPLFGGSTVPYYFLVHLGCPILWDFRPNLIR